MRARRLRIALAAVLTTTALASCAVAPSQAPSPGTSPTPTPQVTRIVHRPPQVTRPKERIPTTSQAPTARLPGRNHNAAAHKWVYSSKVVQGWLNKTTRSDGKKRVFLTFDDGPTSEMTPRVLAILKKEKVHASFFYIGYRLDKPATHAIARQTIAQGHSICVHTQSHNYHYLYPGRLANPAHIVADQASAMRSIRRVLGSDFNAHCYRYPGGHISWKGLAPADRALAARGYYWLEWNALTGDADTPSPTTVAGQLAVIRRSVAEAKNKTVVVLQHDYGVNHLLPQTLPQVIRFFKQQGYEFGTLD